MNSALATQNILEFESVGFAYDTQPILQNIDLQIKYGEIRAIVGPNGGGKSTLLKLALGLLKRDAGEIRLLGHKVENFSRWDAVGYVPQSVDGLSNSLYPATVREVISHGIYQGNPLWRLLTRKPKVTKGGWDEAIEITDVGDLLSKQYVKLSAGQRQRVLIARSLVKSPQLLLLDEPVASVDFETKSNLNDMLKDINRSAGVTIVMVTHDISLVRKFHFQCACLNCALIYDGPAEQMSNEYLSDIYTHTIGELK